MRGVKVLISAAAAATLMGCTAAPAFADVIGGTAYGVQTTTVNTTNTLISPTGVSVQSTWIYVSLPGTTIPVDPPVILF